MIKVRASGGKVSHLESWLRLRFPLVPRGKLQWLSLGAAPASIVLTSMFFALVTEFELLYRLRECGREVK